MTTMERLISELLAVPGMMVVIDSHGAVSEMDARDLQRSEFHEGWATIEATDWHVHLNMGLIDEAQFVEAEDRFHQGIPKLYYLRLSDAEANTMLRFYFPNPWLNDQEEVTDFQPDRLRLFEEFRDRYIVEPGIVFAQV